MLIVVHSLLFSSISFLHLTFKKLSIFMVNLSYLIIQCSLLVFIILSVKFPHSGLLINMGFFQFFSKLLLFYLSCKLITHSLLIWFQFIVHQLIIHSILNFFLLFKSSNFHFLLSCFLIHLLQHSISHSTHEFLSSFFSPFKFLSSIFFLL